jgi:NTP pyrophosphatase (non-canonical NTP hydrolase)
MDIVSSILQELDSATAKFPNWPTDPIHAFSVIAEEVGEVQKAVLEAVYEPHKGSREAIRGEAVQVAAMCLRFIASLDSNRYEWTKAKQHEQ